MSEVKVKRLLSYKEASEYLGISQSQLKRLVRAGELPVIKIGKRSLLDIHDLDEYIERRRRVRHEG